MANAIEQLRSGLTVGHAGLALRGTTPVSPRAAVHDGDTISTRAVGNLPVRFLGVDAPEASFPLPGSDTFVAISDERWARFLDDPFAAALPAFKPALQKELREQLAARVGEGCAANHARHSEVATKALTRQVEQDVKTLGQDKQSFRLFLAFAQEVIDRYGRLLAYLNREQPDRDQPEPRPASYNQRLLTDGLVMPYFIWPNVDPFRAAAGLLDAVPNPGTQHRLVARSPALRAAREAVRRARADQRGLGLRLTSRHTSRL
jgi:endonuclease YncB( thermonuclease family)